MTPLTFLYTALGPTLLSEGRALWLWGAVAVLGLVGLPRLLEQLGWIRPESWPHREGR